MKTKSRNPDQNLISHLPLLPAEESPFKGIFRSSHSILGLNLVVLTLPSLNRTLRDNSSVILVTGCCPL
uniref:Uncharacterized protein n=1 Tax=Salix viminalis TaxID=40686 RepID=A0A6N2LHT5_SALVM